MDINELKYYLNVSSKICDNSIKLTLKNESGELLNELKRLSPVDKGDYRDSWKNTVYNGSNGTKSEFTNDMVYGPVIEKGSIPGNKPWPNPGPKTILSDGRIFSTQAIGGTIDKVFSNQKINILANELAKTIEGSFK